MGKIEELRKTFDATTSGEWTRQGAYVRGPVYTILREAGAASIREDQANTKFVALAHNTMPTLLKAVDLCERSLRALHEDDFPQLRDELRTLLEDLK